MFRFIYTLIVGYIILKIIRLFIDPLFQPKKATSTPSIAEFQNATPKKQNSNLGEYIDYEEVK